MTTLVKTVFMYTPWYPDFLLERKIMEQRIHHLPELVMALSNIGFGQLKGQQH